MRFSFQMLFERSRNCVQETIEPGTSYAPINAKLAGWGREAGHTAGIWSIALAPGVGHLSYLAVPGVEIFELLQTFDHKSFPGWEISVIFDFTFLPRSKEFYCNFFGKRQIPALCPASPPPSTTTNPAGLTLIGALLLPKYREMKPKSTKRRNVLALKDIFLTSPGCCLT